MLCFAEPWYAVLCLALLRYATLCQPRLWYSRLCCDLLCQAIAALGRLRLALHLSCDVLR